MALTWPAKHPAAVLSYSWTPAVDAGDTLITATLTVTSGTVDIDDQQIISGDLVAVLSGGTAGEVTAFHGAWTSASGQSDEETIYLPVNASASSDPNVAGLKLRYPAFASVDDTTIAYWLTDSERYVDATWSDADMVPAKMAHAAYEMAKAGVTGFGSSEIAAIAASGVTNFKSGAFQAQFSEKAVEVAVAGGYESNIYGLEYLALARRRSSGPFVTSPGCVPCGGYPFGYGYGPC